MSITREIARKAATDNNFRTRLMKDPRSAIEMDFGKKVPADISVHVHENTPTELHVVVEAPVNLATSRALTDDELRHVSGGLTSVHAITGTNTHCRLV